MLKNFIKSFTSCVGRVFECRTSPNRSLSVCELFLPTLNDILGWLNCLCLAKLKVLASRNLEWIELFTSAFLGIPLPRTKQAPRRVLLKEANYLNNDDDRARLYLESKTKILLIKMLEIYFGNIDDVELALLYFWRFECCSECRLNR